MNTGRFTAEQVRNLRGALLVWYDRSRRDLPWRRSGDPYAIWVSEIMLQQTRVAAVLEHYARFLTRFPSLASLAAAGEDEVLAVWSGLGYYRRARMLHKAAQFVMQECGGRLPATAVELRRLPGIGTYTAAAIASIGFGEAEAVVDGNVQRVLTRIHDLQIDLNREGPPALTVKDIPSLAQRLLDPRRPGDFNQAMMELGATVCVPGRPDCARCPVIRFCQTRGEHAAMPAKKMLSREAWCALTRRKGRLQHGLRRTEILLERRSVELSLMPGMWELPPLAMPPGNEPPMLKLRHSITTTNYAIGVFALDAKQVPSRIVPGAERRWVPVNELERLPLTGLSRKILKRVKLWPGFAGNMLPVALPGDDRKTVVI